MHARLTLKKQMKTNAQLVLFARLLAGPHADFERAVREELAQNPALELVERGGRAAHRRGGGSAAANAADPQAALEAVADRPSVRQQLETQIRLLADGPVCQAAIYLLYCLDEHGYLVESVEAPRGLDAETMAAGRHILHQLDPPGLGARDLRECLLLQCRRYRGNGAEGALAERLLAQAWEEVSRGRWRAAARRLGAKEASVAAARAFIRRSLHPYPLLLLADPADGDERYHSADVVIRRQEGHPRYLVELPGADAFELKIGDSFTAAAGTPLSAEDRAWVQEQVQQARLFLAAVQQRWQTLARIARYLVDYQRAFLDSGPLQLRSLTRAAVADALSLHPATVGRAVDEKVVQLPNGRLTQLADFFDDSLRIKAAIPALLAESDGPLSDRQLAEKLGQQGLRLARRTVTKYRRQLGIRTSYARGSWT